MSNHKLTQPMRDQISSILGVHIWRMAREDAMMQAATAVLDAQAELERCKLRLEALRGEIKTLAALAIKKQGGDRLVLTRKEFNELPDCEVHVEAPEPGIRIYILRN